MGISQYVDSAIDLSLKADIENAKNIVPKLTFLEQFGAFKKEALDELEKVCMLGLTTVEHVALEDLIKKLTELANKYNPNK